MRVKWKEIKSQEDMPKVSGDYIAIDKRDPLPSVEFISRYDKWDTNIVAYIPEPIPEWIETREVGDE